MQQFLFYKLVYKNRLLTKMFKENLLIDLLPSNEPQRTTYISLNSDNGYGEIYEVIYYTNIIPVKIPAFSGHGTCKRWDMYFCPFSKRKL